TTREYLGDSLVLATTLHGAEGELLLTDCLVCGPQLDARRRRLLRIAECRRGHVELEVHVEPRFDYGDVRPWLRREGPRATSAIGGDDALVIVADVELEADDHELHARVPLAAGERVRLALTATPPELLEARPAEVPEAEQLDAELEETLAWWREWAGRIRFGGPEADHAAVRRSALALKALTYEPTGAIVAAPTTSLPERLGADANWDYRYSWIRDSSFSARSFAQVGCDDDADRFRAFIERSAAGHAQDLKVLYGVGGERRISEQELALDGYAGSRPVRIGNGAAGQLQLDTFGELVNLSWRWHRRGHSPDDDHWRFLVSLVDEAAERWREPDAGIWERRGDPRHWVHSKVLCWAALDRGLRLAEECMRQAPVRRWTQARDELRATIERRGHDAKRGVFVRAFGDDALDAALLLLPTVEFVAWDDERMVRTVAAIRERLGDEDGALLRRCEDEPDGGSGDGGAFLACSFWLVECLARQGEHADARAVFDRASATANDLGLFSEEWDPQRAQPLGNFPQGLTHLAQIGAALALADADAAP
ncbi:MAG TPA: glycoside hydrolase family 15 protein, partial [Conexibacter sp.]|nr:glycoside hydrolase family 15 protein [Conexibacter sp.]